MSTTPEDFILSAEEMLNDQREINYRNAASRAYQAAHLACRTLRQRLNLAPLVNVIEKEGTHKQVIRALLQTPLPKEKGGKWEQAIQIRQLGHMLNTARDLRSAADYGLDHPFSLNRARQLLLSSRIILDRVERLLDEEGKYMKIQQQEPTNT